MIRRFILWLFGRRLAAEIETESRQWIMRCRQCGEEISVWDAGGIRWKAKGSPTRRMRCRSCGQATWHTVTFRAAEK
jgi:ribosomal protein L37E